MLIVSLTLGKRQIKTTYNFSGIQYDFLTFMGELYLWSEHREVKERLESNQLIGDLLCLYTGCSDSSSKRGRRNIKKRLKSV